jgi:hypothetical protein
MILSAGKGKVLTVLSHPFARHRLLPNRSGSAGLRATSG